VPIVRVRAEMGRWGNGGLAPCGQRSVEPPGSLLIDAYDESTGSGPSLRMHLLSEDRAAMSDGRNFFDCYTASYVAWKKCEATKNPRYVWVVMTDSTGSSRDAL
jgi:hypothetical protein